MNNEAETETTSEIAPVVHIPGPIPVNRTFRFCDHRGNLIATISLEASFEIEAEPGISISPEEVEARFRKAFRLSFVPIRKGKETEAIFQTDGEARQEKRPKKVLSEEHKRRMQGKIEADSDVILSGFNSGWRGKAEIVHCMTGSLSDGEWNAALKYLLESRQIEKRGEKRGSQYRKVGG